jgi:Crinkler effector protein N-terminal domain
MTLSLNCFILSDDPDQTFTVKILQAKNVSILKDLIKEKKAFDSTTSTLQILTCGRSSFPSMILQRNRQIVILMVI